jgi:hypothetical protein
MSAASIPAASATRAHVSMRTIAFSFSANAPSF